MSFRRHQALVLATVLAFGAAQPAHADSEFIETSGRVLMIGLPVAGGAYALWTGDRRGFWQIGASVASAYGASYLLQQVVREERPDHSGWDSFPSDSTAIAFAAASSIQVRYGWDYGLPATPSRPLSGTRASKPTSTIGATSPPARSSAGRRASF